MQKKGYILLTIAIILIAVGTLLKWDIFNLMGAFLFGASISFLKEEK